MTRYPVFLRIKIKNICFTDIQSTGLRRVFFYLFFIAAFSITAQEISPMQKDEGTEEWSIHQLLALPSPSLSIAAVGDLMLSAVAESTVVANGADYPYEGTRDVLMSADIAVANLEAPLTATGTRFVNKKYTFKVPPAFVTGIKNAGFDVVTLANNHIMDWGSEGLANTLAVLDSQQIAHCGAGVNRLKACEPVVMESCGFKVAFIGFSLTFPQEFWATRNRCGTCLATDSLLQQVITAAEADADVVVVNFHWGAEKWTSPKEYQIHFAHLAIDLGADLVLGHHPHVLQGLEVYKNRLIAYSLGNYAFGSRSQTARDSILLTVHVNPSGLVQAQVNPISVYNSLVRYQPRLMQGPEKERVLSELNHISLMLNQGQNIISPDGTILP